MSGPFSFGGQFEELLRTEPDDSWRRATIEVMDTAFLVNVWLQERAPLPYTAGDVAALTRLIIQRKHQRDFEIR
jgi:hypothetical protein